MEKTWYNVNINGARVEQFNTVEEAQQYIDDFKSRCYITKSIYSYDEACVEWNEISEKSLND
jgi:hypothetical protein